MNEMINRVAKALYDNMCLANPHVQGTYEQLDYTLQSFYVEQARAAIQAMQEPTFEIANRYWGQPDGYDVWRDMIEEALK